MRNANNTVARRRPVCVCTVFGRALFAGVRQRRQCAGGGINLVPFTVLTDTWHEIQHGNTAYFLINFLGNIIMFLPIGFFVPLLWRGMPLCKTVWIGFLCSLCIELCQLFLPRGTDIDDLFLNTLGAVAGYGLYALCRRLWPVFTARCKVIKQ